MFLPIDLASTPLAIYEEYINYWADEFGVDPFMIATIILVESGGKPDAFNEKSKATGLGGIMPQEAGEVFKDRPTIEELKDPNTNIYWIAKIFSSRWYRLHSDFGALYQYSGGKVWKSVDEFINLYLKRFNQKRKGLIDAGARYKVTHGTNNPIE